MADYVFEMRVPQNVVDSRVRDEVKRQLKNPALYRRVIRAIEANFAKTNMIMERAVRELTRDVARNTRANVSMRSWKGTLVRSIQARKLSGMRYGVTIADYGWYVDGMRPHKVNIYRTAHGEKVRGRVKDWIADKYRMKLNKGKQVKYPYRNIRVRPHPFISRSLKMSRIPSAFADHIRRFAK